MTYTNYTYFWERPSPFSQWTPCVFTLDGMTFNTSEQYMMVGKARLFGDYVAEAEIMQAKDPRFQKQIGRRVLGFNEAQWADAAKAIVYRGNHAKFTQNPEFLKALLATEGTLLVEASPYDRIWGIGITERQARAGVPWNGTNWLGEVLTTLRDNLIAERHERDD